jgi:uncharacterized protein (DUF305 family)
MSDRQMAALDTANGAAFDRVWVTMTISRHTGAITMAKTERASGRNVQAKDLARAIITRPTTAAGRRAGSAGGQTGRAPPDTPRR